MNLCYISGTFCSNPFSFYILLKVLSFTIINCIRSGARLTVTECKFRNIKRILMIRMDFLRNKEMLPDRNAVRR